MTRRDEVAWIVISLIIRLPIVLLPAPGRDEATYYNWAMQDHGGYAPLMLSTVRLAEAAGLSSLGAIRIPALLVGTALVWAIARYLRVMGASRRWGTLALGAVVCSPWFVYVGSTLHPDAWLATCVVSFATAWVLRASWTMAVWAAFAALSKPSGALIAVTAAILILADRGTSVGRRIGAALLAAAGAVVAFAALGPERVAALGSLSKLDPTASITTRAVIAVGTLVLFAGPAFLIHALGGAVRPVRSRAWTVAMTTAGIWSGSLILALVTGGQFKANWWLPGLLPLALLGRDLPRRLHIPGWSAVAIGAVLALGTALAFTAPHLVDRLEANARLTRIYRVGAGEREARVSGTTTWSERVGEYRSVRSFAAEIRERAGWTLPPKRIVTDDYGLAAQLGFCWAEGRIELDVPEDPIQPTARPTTGASVWLWRSEAWAKRHGAPVAVAMLPHPGAVGSDVFFAIDFGTADRQSESNSRR